MKFDLKTKIFHPESVPESYFDFNGNFSDIYWMFYINVTGEDFLGCK